MKLQISGKGVGITISFLRTTLAIIVFFILFTNDITSAAYLFICTACLSFFERFLQRTKRIPITTVVDALADKLLVNLTAIGLWLFYDYPGWVVVVFLGRDIFTILGASYLFVRGIQRKFTPSLLGKIALFAQMIAIATALLGQFDMILTGAAVALTAISMYELFIRSEFRKLRKKQYNPYRLSSIMKLADIITLINVIFGISAIFLAINQQHGYAAIALILAVVADYFDGKVARKLKQENNFGKELDSLSDTISFGVAPAIFGFSLIQTPIAIVAFTIFLFCGILRLAKFSIMDFKGTYLGMPITTMGILVPLVYILGTPIDWYPYIYLLLGVLMISNIKIKKLH